MGSGLSTKDGRMGPNFPEGVSGGEEQVSERRGGSAAKKYEIGR
jgi:hypothetical protein